MTFLLIYLVGKMMENRWSQFKDSQKFVPERLLAIWNAIAKKHAPHLCAHVLKISLSVQYYVNVVMTVRIMRVWVTETNMSAASYSDSESESEE